MKALIMAIVIAATALGQNSSGDPDGSGSVTINDVVYLIQYIFNGGPAPEPMDCPELLEGVFYDDTDWIEWYAGSVTFRREDNVVKRVYTVDHAGKPTWYYLVPDTSDWWDSGFNDDSLVMSRSNFAVQLWVEPIDTTGIDWGLIHKVFLYDLWVNGDVSYRWYLDYRLGKITIDSVRFNSGDTLDQSWFEYSKDDHD